MDFILIIAQDVYLVDLINQNFPGNNIIIEHSRDFSNIEYLISKCFFSIIIIDTNCIDMNRVRYVAKEVANAKIVLISSDVEDDKIVELFKLDILDFITVPISEVLLVQKIKKIIKINKSLDSIMLVSDECTITINSNEIKLTVREFDLFELLYTNSIKVFSKDQLIDRIWMSNFNMSDKLVEVTIYNLRCKLGVHKHYIKTVRGRGYTFDIKKE